MKLKNKYQKCSKITEPKFRQILRLFAFDLSAPDTAKLTGINIKSINNLYLKLSLFEICNISTVSNPFGAMPSIVWYNLTECRSIPFTCI